MNDNSTNVRKGNNSTLENTPHASDTGNTRISSNFGNSKINRKFAATFSPNGKHYACRIYSLQAFFMLVKNCILAVCNPRASALMCLLPFGGESQRDRASRFFIALNLQTL